VYTVNYEAEDLITVLVCLRKSYVKHFKKALGVDSGCRYKFKVTDEGVNFNVRIEITNDKIIVNCLGVVMSVTKEEYREFLAEYAYRHSLYSDGGEYNLNHYRIDNPELIKLIYTICENPETVMDSICDEADMMFTLFSKFDYRLAPNQTRYTTLTLNLSKRDFVVV
jgi:hypothetical protein